MAHSGEVDGFRLAYDDHPADHPVSTAVVLLHGWPGDRRDYRRVVPLLAGRCRVVVLEHVTRVAPPRPPPARG